LAERDAAERDAAIAAEGADAERARADAERAGADAERARAEAERTRAEDAARQRIEEERRRLAAERPAPATTGDEANPSFVSRLLAYTRAEPEREPLSGEPPAGERGLPDAGADHGDDSAG
jgi:hypothetical protein